MKGRLLGGLQSLFKVRKPCLICQIENSQRSNGDKPFVSRGCSRLFIGDEKSSVSEFSGKSDCLIFSCADTQSKLRFWGRYFDQGGRFAAHVATA